MILSIDSALVEEEKVMLNAWGSTRTLALMSVANMQYRLSIGYASVRVEDQTQDDGC